MLQRFSKYALLLVPFIPVAHATAALPGQQNKQELDRLERQTSQALIEEAKRTEQLIQQQKKMREAGDQPWPAATRTGNFRSIILSSLMIRSLTTHLSVRRLSIAMRAKCSVEQKYLNWPKN